MDRYGGVLLDWEPGEDGDDVMVRGGPGDDLSDRVWDQLEFMEGLLGEAKEERVAVKVAVLTRELMRLWTRYGG